jgi:hypothetical protein
MEMLTWWQEKKGQRLRGRDLPWGQKADRAIYTTISSKAQLL